MFNSFQSNVIYKISAISTGSRYFLSFNAKLGTLFASFPNEKIVFAKKLNLENPTDDSNDDWFSVAGNSKQCFANQICGDGGLATEASLAFPKVS
jgi:hypothetical protein